MLAKLTSSGMGAVEDSDSGDPKDTSNYCRQYGRGPADQHIGRSEEESSVANVRDVQNTQDKRIPGCWGNVDRFTKSKQEKLG